MQQTTEPNKRVVDVTGLPEEAIRALESLVSTLRAQPTARTLASVSPTEWRKAFDAWMNEVAGRAGRYPPGFVLDDSRESIYEGRGE